MEVVWAEKLLYNNQMLDCLEEISGQVSFLLVNLFLEIYDILGADIFFR